MLDPQTLPFVDWLPDQALIDLGGVYDVLNVFADTNSYKPWRNLVSYSNALATACVGSIAARDTDGNTSIFAGTQTRLYILDNSASTWTDVTQSLSDMAVPTLEFWGMDQFGDDVIATNIGNVPQVYTLGSSSAFANLGGSPPNAKHIGIVRDFVVLGNLSGGANSIQWSAFNDDTGWTAGVNQSDTQEFPNAGQVQGIVGGEVGYVILESAIFRMTYVGGDLIFQIDEVERDRGTQSPKSIVRYGSGFFYYGRDGFYYFDGQQSQPIGSQKVDLWFRSNADPAYLRTIVGGYDPLRRIMIWAFTSVSSPDGTHDTILVYNPFVQKFSKVTQGIEFLTQTTSAGYTLEGLDAVNSNLDALTPSLDSSVWAGGTLTFTGFGTTHMASAFSGTTLAATVTTQEKNLYQGMFCFVNDAVPIVDTNSASVAIGTRARYGDSVSLTTAVAMQSNGTCPQRAYGKTAFAQMTIPAGTEWTHGEGITIYSRQDGVR